MLLYGSENISAFAYIDLGQVLFVFTFYKLMLSMEGEQKMSAKQLASEMFHSKNLTIWTEYEMCIMSPKLRSG